MKRTAERQMSGRGIQWQIGVYFGSLWLALGLAAPGGGIAAVPVQFYLKDRLHLGPQELALFGAITSIPLYLGFAFGFLRDRWRPFGLRDRGYFLLAAPLALATYLWLATRTATFSGLVIALLAATLLFQVLSTATQALATQVAQRELMTGRLSALSWVAQVAPGVIAAVMGGWMVQRVSASGIFAMAAASTALFLVQSLRQPQIIRMDETERTEDAETSLRALCRLLRHRPIWPAAAILCLWNFSPASHTPIFYHLTEKAGVSSEAYGIYLCLYSVSCIPTALLYGRICRRLPLRRLLQWATALAVLQVPFYLLCHSPFQAMVAALVTGLMCGFAHVAFADLLMRSCPEGLEGTANGLAGSGIAFAIKSGDLLGSWLYLQGGFALTVLATLLAALMIVPLLRFVPRSLAPRGKRAHLPRCGCGSNSAPFPKPPFPLAPPSASERYRREWPCCGKE